MKTIKLFILVGFIASFIQACNLKSKPIENMVINNVRTCYPPYEINPIGNNDTINRMFYDGTKLGHWIVFDWICGMPGKTLETAKPLVRIKVEEGNYVNGKKEGFWKLYRQDGTLRDSVFFKNGEGGC